MAMAHATPSGSARIAIGMKSLHKSVHTTRQQQRKRALNDTIDGPVSREQISNKDTGNESEVLRDLLHSYGCRVMILRAVKNSVDDTFSTLRVQHSTDKTMMINLVMNLYLLQTRSLIIKIQEPLMNGSRQSRHKRRMRFSCAYYG